MFSLRRRLGEQKRKLIGGIGAHSFAIVVRVLQQLLLVPVLIGLWGIDAYQDWLVIFSAANCLTLVDFGMQLFLGNEVLAAWSRQDTHRYRRVLGYGLCLYGVVVIFALFAVAAAAWSVSLSSFVVLHSISQVSGTTAFILLAIGVIVSVPLGLFTAIYRAKGDYALSVGVSIVGEAVRAVGICIAAAAGGGIVSAAWVYLVISVFLWIGIIADQRIRYKESFVRPVMPTASEFRNTVEKSSLYWMHFLVGPVVTNGPILLLNSLQSSANTVVLFSVSRTLIGLVKQIILQPNLTVGMEIARLIAIDKIAEAKRLFLTSSRWSCAAAGLLGGLTLVLAKEAITVWTHGSVTYDAIIVSILLFGVVANVPGWNAYNLYQFTNRAKPIGILNVIYALSTIVVAAVLGSRYSTYGVVVGICAAELIAIGIAFPILATAWLNLSVLRFFSESAGLVVATFASSYAIAELVKVFVPITGLSGLILVGSIWLVVLLIPSAIWLALSRKRLRNQVSGE